MLLNLYWHVALGGLCKHPLLFIYVITVILLTSANICHCLLLFCTNTCSVFSDKHVSSVSSLCAVSPGPTICGFALSHSKCPIHSSCPHTSSLSSVHPSAPSSNHREEEEEEEEEDEEDEADDESQPDSEPPMQGSYRYFRDSVASVFPS